MTALRLPTEPPTTSQAAEIEARRRRDERVRAEWLATQRPGCTAWHAPGTHCEHPVGAQVIRDEDEAGDAAAGMSAYVRSEAMATRERSR